MAHSLLRFTSRLYSVPHLITQDALAPILDYLNNRNAQLSSTMVEGSKEAAKPTKMGSVGEIKIDGALTYQPVEGMCGAVGTSYKNILEQAQMLIDEGVSTLVTVHSSGGGEAAHCFATASDLREMCDEAGVAWLAYIDTYSASASLAIGIAADEVIIHPSASTGSIGCVVCLMDQSKALDNAGLKPIYIASSEGKTPFEASGAFSKDFIVGIQEDVTRLGLQFAQHVSNHTGLPVDDILAMNAKMYHAEAALEAGLVNSIQDHKQFAKHLAEISKGKKRA